jgi:hypothetical protein
MDLRSYYRKLRDTEASITGEHVVVVSLATPEGGREGVLTEAPRAVAAKLIAELRARLATKEESKEFHGTNVAARKRHEQEEAANRVQVMVIPSSDLRKPVERS